jgi:hypothetical protein
LAFYKSNLRRYIAAQEPHNLWEKKIDRALFSGNCNQPETSPR